MTAVGAVRNLLPDCVPLNMEKYIQLGKEYGLKGAQLRAFVADLQQNIKLEKAKQEKEDNEGEKERRREQEEKEEESLRSEEEEEEREEKEERCRRQDEEIEARRGKSRKGLGRGGAKRQRKILRDNIQGITKPAIRR
ncbi:hypothetical protein OS493_037171 [Desmophyllum pertusum]|uniref:Uncharacterized protein n=1 Tax=Desmophyllum pertusum TaxID=174260 RepID=A0A9X0CVQ9_9CNID|nr:hypothetical protein OS493_037171 [Desmophyllum pertusum]